MRWVGKVMLVFVLTASLLIHSMAFNVQPVEATWYSDTNYTYRKELTIDSTKVSGTADHSNFPVLVSYSDTDLRTTTDGGHVTNSNGHDIIFTDDNKTTKLDHEIESYSSSATTGTIVMWVRFPTLPYNTDKDFYIYYGNSNIATSQENVYAVWNSIYEGVLHMAGHINDSVDGDTADVERGTVYSESYGKIGQGVEVLDDDHVDYNPGSDFSGTTYSSGTVSFWVNTSDWSYNYMLDHGYITGFIILGQAGGGSDSTREVAIYWAGWKYSICPNTVQSGVWHHVFFKWNTAGWELRLDGAAYASESSARTAGMSANGVGIGDYSGDINGYSLCGYIDEVRGIGGTELSNDWGITEYNNQNNQGTGSGKFIKTLGTEEEIPELVILMMPLVLATPFLMKYIRRRKDEKESLDI